MVGFVICSFFLVTASTEIYTLSLHDALPISSALAGGAMSKLFGGGQKAASGGIQGDVLATGGRSEERFSRNAETDLVCCLLPEKNKHPRGRARKLCSPVARRLSRYSRCSYSA